MIGRLNGVLAALDNNLALIDVHDVGYDVTVPMRVAERLEIGQTVLLHTHLQTHNEEQTLFGFTSEEDRFVFRKLLTVPGLGPRIAVGILSELSGSNVAAAIISGNSQQFAAIKGIGKKTSETIVFKFRDDVLKWGIGEDGSASSGERGIPSGLKDLAVKALRQLGFQRTESETAVNLAYSEGIELEELTRRSLSLVGTSV